MKKYLKLLPLILYPYMYLILFIIFLIINNISGGNAGIENGFFIGIILLIVYNIYVLCISVYNAVITAKNNCKASEAAKINLIIKGSQMRRGDVFRHMGGGLQQLDFHLQGRVAENPQELCFRLNLGRHQIEQQNPKRTNVLSHGAPLGHDEDIFIFQYRLRRQLVRNLDRHINAPLHADL